eukprot:gb/GECH01002120.1/.p1 GENE.gb/GECH01002120.1/~~gb/GECH01002120.1/.p1  ORF type:complete len:248 (+),score=54.35 gb/GECH01002120.1/:1-744(+)
MHYVGPFTAIKRGLNSNKYENSVNLNDDDSYYNRKQYYSHSSSHNTLLINENNEHDKDNTCDPSTKQEENQEPSKHRDLSSLNKDKENQKQFNHQILKTEPLNQDYVSALKRIRTSLQFHLGETTPTTKDKTTKSSIHQEEHLEKGELESKSTNTENHLHSMKNNSEDLHVVLSRLQSIRTAVRRMDNNESNSKQQSTKTADDFQNSKEPQKHVPLYTHVYQDKEKARELLEKFDKRLRSIDPSLCQ